MGIKLTPPRDASVPLLAPPTLFIWGGGNESNLGLIVTHKHGH